VVLCGVLVVMIKMSSLSLARHWHDLMWQYGGYLCRDFIISRGKLRDGCIYALVGVACCGEGEY
jgi:hypothetical protein